MSCDLRRCSKCLLPETYETIEFDDKDKCNMCHSTEHKQNKVDWVERKKLLDQLVEKYKGKSDYDCIVPFSGGKDSTFQLYYLMKEYNLKPLVIRFNHGFLRNTIQKNVERTLKKLGADFLEFTPNWHIVKRLMQESFRRKTDFCWHCHTGIYSYPLQIAVKFNIPLIFWGEPLAEISCYYDYINDEVEYEDEKRFNMCRNLGISADDMYEMIRSGGMKIDRRDLNPFSYPALRDLKRINYCSVCLGSFIPWDYHKNSEIIKKELGWELDELEGVPDEINQHGEKIECFMQGTRDYIKFLKRGYTRVSQICAFDLRNGRMSVEDAKQYIENEGKEPHSLKFFLEYVGLSREEFYDIVAKAIISPYSHDFTKKEFSKEVADMESWYTEHE